MAMRPLDPAPRTYAASVYLLRRSDRSAPVAGEAAAGTTPDAVLDWLTTGAIGETDTLALFEGLAWRLVAAGLPLDRASLHVGTLHPQMIGFAWNWARADGLCDEIRVDGASLKTDAYRRNPLFRVIEHGETVRVDTADPAARDRFPLVADLAGQGITDYVAMPLGGGAYHNAVTLATRQPGGFGADQYAVLERVLALLALHVARHIALRIATNVLDTYLGAAAGTRVLEGSIRRGAGEAIRAVIWASDLRGFTDLTDRLAAADMIVLLNAYFERMAGAVLAEGGEVLKFIGDGLLAVFPFDRYGTEQAAAEASLAAARRALADLDEMNAKPPAGLADVAGWQPLKTGIALHAGEVFFGNVGAPERLDFTVIGPAVNAAARVEAMSKMLGRPLLLTGPVASHIAAPLDDLGAHTLRGVAEPIRLFAAGEG